jgi:uncharacterized repeat protein (TIGR01451 family)/fimbrial isopeptide formation D2 family protein
LKQDKRILALIALLSAVAFSLVLVAPASADGTPDLQLGATSTSPLYGENGAVSATASLGSGQPSGYNLSFRAVLPPGISYAGGSPIAPTVINDAPGPGETTLIFSNVSDLFANSSQGINFNVAHDQLLFEVDDIYTIEIGAFVNADPRFLPRFNALGEPIPSSYTGFATESPAAKILAVTIDKSEPSREGKLLRGVHDHQTVYTLRVRNNAVNTTSSTTIDDFLPAGLEFLGCSTNTDNTTDAPTNPGSPDEYPGSGPIIVDGVSDCFDPEFVETVSTDPDGPGPMPLAVYTHVRWNTGDLAPSEEIVYRYRAAIPLVENTTTWSGSVPTPVSGEQAVNLDNNSGPEVRDGQALTNYAVAGGIYESGSGDQPVNASDTQTVTAKDLLVHKSASSGTLGQGAITTWQLRIRTGEYRYANDIVVTDTLPSGLCPLGPVNYTTQNDPSDAECDPTGNNPSAPYTSATENANGTFTIVWDATSLPALGSSTVNSDFTISFPTRTRTSYQSNFLPTTPILAEDSLSNTVNLEGQTYSRCTPPGTPDCSTPGPQIPGDAGQPADVTDNSSAGQQAPGVPLLRKEVALPGTTSNCLTATYVNTVPDYRPGDKVCWRLTIDFAPDTNTFANSVFDFLPPDAQFISGSAQSTPGNTTDNVLDDSQAANQLLEWEIVGVLAIPRDQVPPGGQKFQVVFGTTVTPVGVIEEPDITANLFKFSITNTPGETFPLRAQAEHNTILPVVDIAKGVRQVNSGPIQNPPADGMAVRGGDTATYQVDVSAADDGAENVEVWDRLPAAFDCTDVSLISNAGICVDGGVNRDTIRWTIPSVAAGTTTSLTYRVLIPLGLGPNNTYVNDSGVRQFQTATNTGGFYTYTPESNIDPSNPNTPNVPAIDDSSNVRTPGVTVVKDRTTSIIESGNSNIQATIGERIDYTVRTTLPSGTTFASNPRITDTPPSAATQPIIVGTPTATLNGGPLPLGWSLTTAGQTVTVQMPDGYQVPVSADDVVEISFSTRVADTVNNANRRGQSRTNQSIVSWTDGTLRTATSNTVSTTIVEPNISQTKTNSSGGNRVAPGTIINFTLTTSNVLASNVSTAHDTLITDVVPVGLTPVDGGGTPIPNGGVVPGTGGAIWNLGTRTITLPGVNILRGANVVWNYAARINDPAVGGSTLTNNAAATTKSIGGLDPNQRTGSSAYNVGYTAASSSSLTLVSAKVDSKTATPSWGTIGTQITYEVIGEIPADEDLYNVTFVDRLPSSLEFDEYVSATCISGCPPDPSPVIQEYDPVVTPAATTIAWDLGNIAPGTGSRFIKFTYKAHVRDTFRDSGSPVVSGNNIINTVEARTNLTDKFTFNPTSLPPASSFDFVSDPLSQTVQVREPAVTLDKEVSVNGGAFVDGPVQSQPGDSLRYRIVLRNNGTSAAYDLAVDDQPDAELTDVVLDQGASFNTKMWTSGDPAMKWQVPGPLAPGDSLTLSYTAEALPSTSLATGSSATNTAGAEYFGVPEAERVNPWTYREYNTGNDTVTVNFEFPELEVTKTTTAAGFPNISDARIGQSFGWRVVLRNGATTAVAFDTAVLDVLPPEWTYDSGSTSITGATTAEPNVTTDPGGDKLAWDFTGQTIAPGASVTITFSATPEVAAKLNPPVQTNDASASTRDASGSDSNASGPYIGSDSAEANLLFPVLAVQKTPDGGTVDAGDTMNWTIAVTNNGTGPATDVVVDDDLDAGMTYQAGTATASPSAGFSEASVSPDPNDGTTPINTIWNISSIPAGQTVTITFPVTALPGLSSGTEINNAVDVTSVEVPTPVSDTGDVTISLSADLEASKSFDPPAPVAGSRFSYTIGVRNLGPSDATGVKLTDPLPAETTFVSAPGCTENSGTVECVVGDLAVGDTQEFEITVDLAPGAAAVSNTVTVSGTTPDPNPSNDTATANFTSVQEADMAITKQAAPGAINQGQNSVFTLVVTNNGPSVAAAVKVDDPLPSGLQYVSDDSGCSEASGNIECLLGDFQPGQSQTIKVTVRGVDVGSWLNTATVESTTDDPNPGNNSASDELLVSPTADLKITKTAPATATAHQTFTYSMLVENLGPSDATNVVISDPLPPGIGFISSADCNSVMTCNLGTIVSGGSRTVEVIVETTPAVAGTTVVNTAEVSGSEFDPDPDNNTSVAETVIDPLAEIAVEKTGPVQAQADTRIVWNVVVTNAGPSPAANVTLSDVLPQEVTNPEITTSQGSCVPAFECELGTIPANGNVVLTIEADIPRNTIVGSTITNSVFVDTTTDEINKNDNNSSWNTEITAPTPFPPNIRIFKERSNNDPVLVGDIVVFRLTASNDGEVAARNVVITDPLSRKLRYISSSIPGGSCRERDNKVTCRRGNLPAMSSVTALVRVQVIDVGRVVNTATIQSDNSIITVPRWTIRFPVSKGSANIGITKKADRRKTPAGGKVNYRIRVSNRTDQAAVNVVACDRLPGGTTVINAGGGRLQGGSICWDIDFLAGRASREYRVTLRVDRFFTLDSIRNRATARAGNVRGVRRASARVGVIRVGSAARGGGVTG